MDSSFDNHFSVYTNDAGAGEGARWGEVIG
jgi:hypothetical protein